MASRITKQLLIVGLEPAQANCTHGLWALLRTAMQVKASRGQIPQGVERDGEVNPLTGAWVLGEGVDPDEIALVVIEAAAAVARIQRGLRLDQPNRVGANLMKAELRHAALRVCPAEPKGIANGHDRIANAQWPTQLPASHAGFRG